MRAVSDAVNDARHDEPDCLEPALPRLTCSERRLLDDDGRARPVLRVDRHLPMSWATFIPPTTPPASA